MAPASTKGMNVAVVTPPDDKEAFLLVTEEQAQWATDDHVQALEEAKRSYANTMNW